jgi:hypothetical protein
VSAAPSPPDEKRSARARQVRELFESVLDLEAVPRAAMLEARCASDPELRAEVEELLAALDRARTADLIPAILRGSRGGQTDGGPGGGFTGLQIGNYRLEAEIGHGGMGSVYRARHLLLARVAAVKILHPHLSGDASMVQRFLNEARAVNDICHPRIVEVLDAGRLASGTPYIVMEHLAGESLAARLRETERLSLAVAVRTARQIAGALGAVHARGIVHRDLKPENVFLCDGGGDSDPSVKVLDFGIAKLRADLAGRGAETHPTGGLLGTPQYMAPEQWRTGVVADPRIDVYALGLIVFEMLSGTPPCQGDSWVDLLHLHLSAAPPRMRERGVDVPEALETLVRRALAKEPGDRLPSMAAFDEELSAFDVEPSGGAHTVVPAGSSSGARPASSRQRTIAAMVIGGVTVTMALLGASRGLRRSTDDRTAVQASTPAHRPPAAAPAAASVLAPPPPAAAPPSARAVAAAPTARPPAPSSQKPATTRPRRSPPAAGQPTSPTDEDKVPAFLRQNPYR